MPTHTLMPSSTVRVLYSFKSLLSHYYLLPLGIFHNLELPGVGLAAEIVDMSIVLNIALFVTTGHLTHRAFSQVIHHMPDTFVDHGETSIPTSSLLTCHIASSMPGIGSVRYAIGKSREGIPLIYCARHPS